MEIWTNDLGPRESSNHTHWATTATYSSVYTQKHRNFYLGTTWAGPITCDWYHDLPRRHVKVWWIDLNRLKTIIITTLPLLYQIQTNSNSWCFDSEKRFRPLVMVCEPFFKYMPLVFFRFFWNYNVCFHYTLCLDGWRSFDW